MKNKYNSIIGLFLLVFMLGFVSSANVVTLDLPVQDASISGATYVLSASLDSNTLNITSANFFYDDGSSNTSIGTTANDTLTVFNLTWDTTTLVDVNNYIIYVNATNETGLGTIDSSTGVDIDNGNPTATLSGATFSNNAQLDEDETFTIGLSADATIGISSCTIYCTESITNVIYSTTTTVSANACSNTTLTPTLFGLIESSLYTCLVEAVDGNSDRTNSSSRVFTYSSPRGGGGGGIVSSSIGSDIVSGSKGFFQWIWDIITFWK